MRFGIGQPVARRTRLAHNAGGYLMIVVEELFRLGKAPFTEHSKQSDSLIRSERRRSTTPLTANMPM
jgi:hypothetical protein